MLICIHVHNNPVNLTDPSGETPLVAGGGLAACFATGGACIIIGGVVVVVVGVGAAIWWANELGFFDGAKNFARQCFEAVAQPRPEVADAVDALPRLDPRQKPNPTVQPTPGDFFPPRPTPIPTSEKSYDLAFGLADHLVKFTSSIQGQTGRPTYHVWSTELDWDKIGKNPETGDYLLLNSGMSPPAYKTNFGIILKNFFLDSPDGLARFNIQDMIEGGVDGPSATQWELEYILSDPISLKRTKFYDYENGKYEEVSTQEATTKIP